MVLTLNSTGLLLKPSFHRYKLGIVPLDFCPVQTFLQPSTGQCRAMGRRLYLYFRSVEMPTNKSVETSIDLDSLHHCKQPAVLASFLTAANGLLIRVCHLPSACSDFNLIPALQICSKTQIEYLKPEAVCKSSLSEFQHTLRAIGINGKVDF